MQENDDEAGGDGSQGGEAKRPGWVQRSWLCFLGFDDPTFRDERIKVLKVPPSVNHIRCADMITKQIEVEQGLSNSRMMWNLTFQGFTIAGYALVASSNGATPAKIVLETAIAFSSILIAYMTLRGVVASQIQRQFLKDWWAENGLSDYFPEPFSRSRTSSRGRLPVYSICLVLMAMWIVLIIAHVGFAGDNEPMLVRIDGL